MMFFDYIYLLIHQKIGFYICKSIYIISANCLTSIQPKYYVGTSTYLLIAQRLSRVLLPKVVSNGRV